MHRRHFLATAAAGTILTTFPLSRAAFAQDNLAEIDLTQKGFSRRFIETPSGTMAIHEAGEGKPLLMIHGVGAGASSFLWYKIAPELAKSYRVIAPDFVGWGASSRPDRNLLFGDYVSQLEVLGDEVGSAANIIAGSLACGFVIDAIDRDLLSCDKLALLSPSGGLDFGIDATPPEALDPFARAMGTPDQEEFYSRLFHRRPAVENWFRAIGFADQAAVPEELIRANVYYARQPNASYSALPFLSGVLRYDIAPYLDKVPEETLMIWGEGEFQIPPPARERIEKANPNIQTARIENARSVFSVEQPAATLEVLQSFFG